jgi:hypothetical protein
LSLCGSDRFADCIIEASAGHLTDRIRNGGRTDGHGDADEHKEADCMTSERARSKAVCILEKWIWRLRAAQGFRALLWRNGTRRQNVLRTRPK